MTEKSIKTAVNRLQKRKSRFNPKAKGEGRSIDLPT